MATEVLTPEQQARLMADIEAMYGKLDNPAIDTMFNTPGLMGRTSKKGRPLISLRDYRRLMEACQPVHEFDMRFADVNGHLVTGPANKFTKHIGLGLVPIEEYEAKQKEKEELKAKAQDYQERHRATGVTVQSGEQVEVYFCKDKYPFCSRFFDTAKGRETHWGIEHEGKMRNAKRTRAKAILPPSVDDIITSIVEDSSEE